jgi:small redox-active disulfide protein 2
MITIKVLGPGCKNCQTLYSDVEKAVAESGVEAVVTKVTDIAEIMQYRVMSSPALVIDEKVVLAGRVPPRSEIVKLIKDSVD